MRWSLTAYLASEALIRRWEAEADLARKEKEAEEEEEDA